MIANYMSDVTLFSLKILTLYKYTLAFIIGTIHCSRHFLSYHSFWLTQFASDPGPVNKFTALLVSRLSRFGNMNMKYLFRGKLIKLHVIAKDNLSFVPN